MGDRSSEPATIKLTEVSKRFGRQYVISKFSAVYKSGEVYGISGRNGSGKSTLLRMIAGQLSPSRGTVDFLLDQRELAASEVYRYVSWTGPYFEIMEELTVQEQLAFHFRLKPPKPGINARSLLERIDLEKFANRKLAECSSGMRQRVLLATALYADTPILLLDEPTLTLDRKAAEWFFSELERYKEDRVVVIASNDHRDLERCTKVVEL